MLRRVLIGSGLAAVAVAVGLTLAPFSGGGLSGNAVAPRYADFGWFAYEPLPENPTPADLRVAGAGTPQERVDRRRREAAAVGGAGLALLAAAALSRRLRRIA